MYRFNNIQDINQTGVPIYQDNIVHGISSISESVAKIMKRVK